MLLRDGTMGPMESAREERQYLLSPRQTHYHHCPLSTTAAVSYSRCPSVEEFLDWPVGQWCMQAMQAADDRTGSRPFACCAPSP